jgi:tyrosyl-tRNA synthetase
MDLFSDLTWRGLVNQTTQPELGAWLASGRRTLYCGFDPTSDSLHVGSLLPVMLLRRFQKAGHRPIPLVGGATGMIGDPSGKSEERNLLSVEQLQKNVAGIERQLRNLLDFEGPTGALLLNNFDWMRGFSYLEFLRDVGKHFPVNVMLAKDSVKGRLASDAGISYTEFSYMLLQAYDFVFLNRQHGCELQIGGSDQWGNITAGTDLARRMYGVQLYGMTCPLLLKSDGTKMGKTERGAIYLAPERTSPYAFYQYWINVADADCGSCLRFLTELPGEEIEALDAARAAQPHLRESQKRLAEELTKLIHGEAGLRQAQELTQIFNESTDEIKNRSDDEFRTIGAATKKFEFARSELDGAGLALVDALVVGEEGQKLCSSKGDARTRIKSGAVYLNNRRVTDVSQRLTAANLGSPNCLVLKVGKKGALMAVLEFKP